MPKEVLFEYLKLSGEADKRKLRFVLQSAPLLKGLKMSCILVVSSDHLKALKDELAMTQIELAELYVNGNRHTILLYRRNQLEDYIKEEQIHSFLTNYGYCGNDWDAHLKLLAKRVSYFNKQKGIFPHEIGIFLGYPLEDVEGFIENAGQNFLMNGYWKVYSDRKMAQARFKKFDEAKDIAAREVFAGKQLCEIVG